MAREEAGGCRRRCAGLGRCGDGDEAAPVVVTLIERLSSVVSSNGTFIEKTERKPTSNAADNEDRHSGGRRQGAVDGGVESTSCGHCGDGGEATPRWRMVDGVVRERLREGRRLRTMGGGGGGRRIRPRQGGGNNYGVRGRLVGWSL